MHFARVPPGQLGEGGVGVGGAGGVGVGGVGGVGVGGAGGAGGRGGEGGAGGPGVLVVPMSPNRIFEKVARCGPPVSVVDTWHGPAFTHLRVRHNHRLHFSSSVFCCSPGTVCFKTHEENCKSVCCALGP